MFGFISGKFFLEQAIYEFTHLRLCPLIQPWKRVHIWRLIFNLCGKGRIILSEGLGVKAGQQEEKMYREGLKRKRRATSHKAKHNPQMSNSEPSGFKNKTCALMKKYVIF
jgi:hypothetical protein